jgi:NADH-quinone oxidoreductase subunit J
MFDAAVFWFFAVILVTAAVCVITARNPVHSALFLVLAFFTAAALWMLLRAEFLAIALVLVYVGAVMVLFLFVVMMLDVNLERLREGFWANLPLGLAVGGVIVVEMIAIIARSYVGTPAPAEPGPGYSNTKELGRVLYTDYAYPLELAAALLLVAIVVAIALTLRKRKDTKYQDPARQIAVRRSERVRLVAMRAEKKD